jgi:hypothetical protein
VVECGQVDLEKEITMPKSQPSFTAEFKHEAVQLTKTSDKLTLTHQFGARSLAFCDVPEIPKLTVLMQVRWKVVRFLRKEQMMNNMKLVVIFIHALIGRTLCAATIGIGWQS